MPQRNCEDRPFPSNIPGALQGEEGGRGLRSPIRVPFSTARIESPASISSSSYKSTRRSVCGDRSQGTHGTGLRRHEPIDGAALQEHPGVHTEVPPTGGAERASERAIAGSSASCHNALHTFLTLDGFR